MYKVNQKLVEMKSKLFKTLKHDIYEIRVGPDILTDRCNYPGSIDLT